jgi:hypothetical protein
LPFESETVETETSANVFLCFIISDARNLRHKNG